MTVTHRSLSIATESSFGSLQANGIPGPTGLTWLSMPVERDPIVSYGDPVFNERNQARDSSTFLPPEPDTMWDGNNARIHRRTGTVNLRMDITTLGSGSGETDYSNTAIGQLLGAFFKSYTPGLQGAQEVTIDGTNANKITATSVTTVEELVSGCLFGYKNAGGITEYSAITAANVGVGHISSFSPALTAGTGSDIDIYPMQTFFPGIQLESGEVLSSVAFRVDGQAFRTYAFGCVGTQLQILVEGGRVMLDATLQAAFITDDHDGSYYSEAFNGPVEPQPLPGPVQHFRGARVTLSNAAVVHSRSDAAGSFGETQARREFKTETFSITVTNSVQPLAHSTSILTMSGMEVVQVNVEASVTLSDPDTVIKNDFRDQVIRQLMISTGPLLSSGGTGCCFFIPAAFLTVDPRKYEITGDDSIVKQTLTYKHARFGGDIKASGAVDVPSNSFFRIGLGL